MNAFYITAIFLILLGSLMLIFSRKLSKSLPEWAWQFKAKEPSISLLFKEIIIGGITIIMGGLMCLYAAIKIGSFY